MLSVFIGNWILIQPNGSALPTLTLWSWLVLFSDRPRGDLFRRGFNLKCCESERNCERATNISLLMYGLGIRLVILVISATVLGCLLFLCRRHEGRDKSGQQRRTATAGRKLNKTKWN